MGSRWCALLIFAAAGSLVAALGVNMTIATRRRTFVFVSGWPQSGTSLVQQIFTVAPEFSTMVNRCHERVGKVKCERWNNEGQWLLGQAPMTAPQQERQLELTKSLLLPGAMCAPANKSMQLISEDAGTRASVHDLLLSQWSQFWDLSKPFLTEKSPQSMLKIPLLRRVFPNSAHSRAKFLIVLKHPASLNVAVPKGMDWLTHDQPGDDSFPKKKLPNSHKQIADNVDFFVDFLSHGGHDEERDQDKTETKTKDKGRKACSLGWIPGVEQLEQHLNSSRQHSLADVRVMRYEHFERPTVACRAIFDFMYDDNAEGFHDAVKRVCNVHFPMPKRTVASNSAPSPLRSRRTKANRQQQQQHRRQRRLLLESDLDEATPRRKLRLHSLEDSLSNELLFRQSAITQSVYQRLQNYFALFHHSAVSNDQREALRKLDARLRRFGYRIAPRDFTEKPLQRLQTALDDWDLLLAYNKRKLPRSAKQQE